MTPNIKLLTILIVLFANTSIAQTTAIPGQNFEQALIDLGIDSDGVVNGQILTADISGVTILDFDSLTYEEIFIDITGIEDFLALEVLDFANQGVFLYDISNANVFSNNINLRELVMTNDCGDCGGVHLQVLDLSGLPNLELVDLTNVEIETLIINNPDFDLTNLSLNLYHEGFPGNDFTQQICIEVDDPQAATNNQPPYNTWNIMYNEFTTSIGFGENCTLSIANYENLNAISIYPNPVKDKLWIENPNQVQLKSVKVFTMQGKLVKSFADVEDGISIPELENGVYFVKINDSMSFTILKE